MRKRVALLALAAWIGGCIGPHGTIGALPPIAAGQPAGEVYIVRNSNPFGGAANYTITLDGQEIFGISVREYTTFKVAAGEHRIGVVCKGGWAPGKHFNEKPAPIEAGKPHYFLARMGGVCAVIVPLSEQLGQEYVAKAKYVPFER